MRKVLRILLYCIGAVITSIILFLLISIVPVDRTPYQEQDFYRVMSTRLDSLGENISPPTSGKFRVGFARKNLVPPFPVATAGYGNRRGRNYSVIHDSIFVRAFVIDNGKQKYAVVSADLLIIPPSVTAMLTEKLATIGFSLDNTYLNATHTHNSIGNWGNGAMELIYGTYNEAVVNFIADRITACVLMASKDMVETSVRTGELPLAAAVRHRIEKGGRLDSLVRVLEFHRTDSIRIIALSYNAHAVCLYSKDLGLSRDYPGKLVDQLEESGYDFAMFLSGAVGSHGCNPPEYGMPCIDWMANEISNAVMANRNAFRVSKDSALSMMRIPLELGEPQMKITKDWRLRPWVFHALVGRNHPYLTALRIGDLVMMGTPCDFAGELSYPIAATAKANGFNVMITSFNGDYIGYITNDKYYDIDHYETRLMNWYGPGNGEYITESMQKLLKPIIQH